MRSPMSVLFDFLKLLDRTRLPDRCWDNFVMDLALFRGKPSLFKSPESFDLRFGSFFSLLDLRLFSVFDWRRESKGPSGSFPGSGIFFFLPKNIVGSSKVSTRKTEALKILVEDNDRIISSRKS